MSNYKKIIEAIDSAKTIGIISHINPDGDNLGSIMALYHSLSEYGSAVRPIAIDGIPDNLDFLPNIFDMSDDIESELDLLICVDCSDEYRLGNAMSLIDKSKVVINIDHHKTNSMFGDINLVDDGAAATGELIYTLLKETELPLNYNAALSIYTAISADTGSFRYSSTTPLTHRIAAELMEFGVDCQLVNENLYQRNSLGKMLLYKTVINRLELELEGRVAYTYVLGSDYGELGLKKSDMEGVVELVRDIEGVQLAFLLKETSDGFRGSFRSETNIDVSEIAMRLNGGGHSQAAGFFVETKDLDEAINTVLNEVYKDMK